MVLNFALPVYQHKKILPEETLPGGEVGSLEQSVLKNALHPSKCLDHVRTVVVQIPQFSIMPLVSPPEWILL